MTCALVSLLSPHCGATLRWLSNNDGNCQKGFGCLGKLPPVCILGSIISARVWLRGALRHHGPSLCHAPPCRACARQCIRNETCALPVQRPRSSRGGSGKQRRRVQGRSGRWAGQWPGESNLSNLLIFCCFVAPFFLQSSRSKPTTNPNDLNRFNVQLPFVFPLGATI